MNQSNVNPQHRGRIAVQEQLLALASIYQDLKRKELAHALRREGNRLGPSNGNPKLDYLIALADVLDWHVGDVAEAIWGGGTNGLETAVQESFEELDAAAKEAHRAGDYVRMCQEAARMRAVAQTPDQRALAALREGGGWDGRGRCTKQLEAIRRGLQEGPLAPDVRLLLEVNLANVHYTIGHLHEARAISTELIERFDECPPSSRSTRAAQAFAYYVRGNANRRLIPEEQDGRRRTARIAAEALRVSLNLYTALVEEYDHDPWRGIAHTCRGGLIEVKVELGEQTPSNGLAAISEGIEAAGSNGAMIAGDQLESRGWWCIFGCNIALRYLEGRELQQHTSMFIKHGYAIAERLDNWSMRERLFTLELAQRDRLNELVGVPVEWTIDKGDIRRLVGTMGRFPSFRSTGWRIFEAATPVTN